MVLPPMISRSVCAGLAAWACVVLCAMAPAEAAQSIRVLLASEVQRLEVRADQTIWVTDAQDRVHFFRGLVRVGGHGPAMVINGTRVSGDHLTLRAGDHDLRLFLPRPNGSGHGASNQLNDDKSALQVSGLIRLVRRGKGVLVVNQVDLEEYVKGVVPAEVNS